MWVAIAPDPRPVGDPAYPFAWYTAGEIEDGLPMFEDSRVLAPVLFECFPAWHAGTAQAPLVECELDPIGGDESAEMGWHARRLQPREPPPTS